MVIIKEIYSQPHFEALLLLLNCFYLFSLLTVLDLKPYSQPMQENQMVIKN